MHREAPNQHIRIISERSCDTEDWSNDAENSEEITYILKYIKKFHINCKMSQYYSIFNQINDSL